MTLTTATVNSLPDLLTHILTLGGPQRRWFRGQGCATFTLTPSLVRRINPYSAAAMIATEQRLITRFRQRSLPFWPEGYPQLDWEHLFAMQHHGVPTRLLDWSESAMVGAFFAADHDPAQCPCGTGNCTPTLWVLDPVALNRHNSRLDGFGASIAVLATSDTALVPWAPGTDENYFAPWPVAMFGTHNSARIVHQQGTFTVLGKSGDPLEQAPAVVEHDVLHKIEITGDRSQFVSDLRRLGLRRSSVYPDLPGLAADITVEELGG